MKRLFIIFLMVIIAGFMFAEGTPDIPQEITVLHGGNIPEIDGLGRYDYAAAKLAEDYPGITVTLLDLDLSDGSTMTMDALLASGQAPNVYVDFIGRVSKYLVPEYALPLNNAVRDLDAYIDLTPYTRGGDVLGLPDSGGAQGMAVNMELMDDIGFVPSWDWTIDDFLDMAELVKEKYNGEKWATGMFAANQSGDYLMNNWFAAAGVKYYANGYDKTTIDQGGAVVYQLFQHMVINEYIPPNAANLTDDDYVIQWAKGDLAATAFFPAWIQPYFDSVVSQGIGKPFEYKFFPFPGTGVPTYVSSAAFVVHNTDTEADAWAARFVEYANSKKVQEALTLQKSVPSRKDAEFLLDDPRVAETARIVQQNGIFDVGLTMPFFAATRPQHYPVLQKVLNLEVTPEEGIAEYAARLNKIIAEQ